MSAFFQLYKLIDSLSRSSLSQSMDGSATAPAEQLELEHHHLSVQVDPYGPGGLPDYLFDETMAECVRSLSEEKYGLTKTAAKCRPYALEQDRCASRSARA